MKIALAQINYTVGDICGNSTKIIAAIERGKAEGADVVIFAEQALCGTPAFDLLRKTTFLELCDEELSKIALHCQGIAAVVGTPMLSESGTHSAAAILEHGKVRRYVTKSKITARREMGFLSNGKGIETVKIAGEKVAIVVGDDFSSLKRIDRDVQILISINARRYGKGMMSYRYQKMHNTAFVNSKDIVLINQVGGSGEIVYDGTSGVFNSRGELTLMMKSFEEDFTIYDTKADNPTPERHEKYADIFYLLEGEELVGVCPMEELGAVVMANPDGDIWLHEGETVKVPLGGGRFLVLFPWDGHAPSIAPNQPGPARKCVVKVRV